MLILTLKVQAPDTRVCDRSVLSYSGLTKCCTIMCTERASICTECWVLGPVATQRGPRSWFERLDVFGGYGPNAGLRPVQLNQLL